MLLLRYSAVLQRMLLFSLFLIGCLPDGSLCASAQTGQSATWVRVSGTVSDAGTKLLLPGVGVRIRRTRQGSVTTAQGNFVLTASPTDTLLFQAVGYRPYLLQLPGDPLPAGCACALATRHGSLARGARHGRPRGPNHRQPSLAQPKTTISGLSERTAAPAETEAPFCG